MKSLLLTLVALACIIFARSELQVPKKGKISKSDKILLQSLLAEARYDAGLKLNSTLGAPEGDKKVSSRISILDAGFSTINGALQHFNSKCHHGYNCGGACGPCTATYGGKCSTSYSFSMRYWTDDLDYACWRHDICLQYYRRKVNSRTGRRRCDTRLASSARSIYNKNYKCAWWQVWCVENWYVTNAWLVDKAMTAMSKMRP